MPDYRNRQRRDRWGAWLARGIAMLVLLLVILLVGYLLIAVIPLGSVEQPDPDSRASYSAEPGNSLLLTFNLDQTRAMRVLDNGQVLRFAPQTGLLHGQFQLQQLLAFDLGDDFHVRQLMALSPADDQRQEYLLVVNRVGEAGLLMWQADQLTDQHLWPATFNLATEGEIQQLSARVISDRLLLAVESQLGDQLQVQRFALNSNTSNESILTADYIWPIQQPLNSLLLLKNKRLLGGLSSGGVLELSIKPRSIVERGESDELGESGEPGETEEAETQVISLASVDSLVTGIYRLEQNMLLVSTQDGGLHQVVDPFDGNAGPSAATWSLAATYDCGETNPLAVVMSPDKRWFGCVDNHRQARLFYLGRQASVWRSASGMPVQNMALTGQQLLIDNNNSLQYLQRSDAPVLDSKLLWQSVWYPGYQQAETIWQPAASSSGGPKFSVTPLLFGTLKAASLALLFGVPFAVLGAIYTSLILARKWRERLKPAVEMMEAMPTVIIGFLAAVWLAPYLQNHLLIGLLLLLGLPLMLVLLGYFWSSILSRRVNKRWHAGLPVALVALLIVTLTGIGWLLEWLLFNGQLSAWLEQQWGWTYDLRNALVVGVALGLAVTPTIFALCEDALTAVPKYLGLGAMALGASRWQAVWQVVVPCAASGLLAAILIGLGRALGETMIVLMAASNTPLVELSPLRGLQAIAPTLAIEMPEADPGGVHFRVLLLCALVLFAITLVANTLAELIRERLRRRYQL